MIVWAQGTGTGSKPSRYHTAPDCFINITGWKKQVPVHKVFEVERETIEALGFWQCPYCDIGVNDPPS